MPLLFAFFLALLLSISLDALMPNLPLMAFTPFVALASLRYPLLKALWLTLIAGLCLDLLSSGERLGLFMSAYLLTVLLVSRYRTHFFENKILTFSLYCAMISSLTTLWIALFFSMVEPRVNLNLPFVATDLLLLPCLDGLVGFLFFIFPHSVFLYIRKKARLRYGYRQ